MLLITFLHFEFHFFVSSQVSRSFCHRPVFHLIGITKIGLFSKKEKGVQTFTSLGISNVRNVEKIQKLFFKRQKACVEVRFQRQFHFVSSNSNRIHHPPTAPAVTVFRRHPVPDLTWSTAFTNTKHPTNHSIFNDFHSQLLFWLLPSGQVGIAHAGPTPSHLALALSVRHTDDHNDSTQTSQGAGLESLPKFGQKSSADYFEKVRSAFAVTCGRRKNSNTELRCL
jgi:hypothetical protein